MLKRMGSALLVPLLLISFLAALSGCHTPAGRTAGDVVDDSTITTIVKAKLFDNKEVSGFAIDVDTFEQVVTLNGGVHTERQKRLAEEIAGSVRDVRSVNNQLVIK